MTHGMFHHFNDAIDDMNEVVRSCRHEPNMVGLAAAASLSMRMGQRFYVPTARDVLAGRVMDEELKKSLKLPYSIVCVLSDSYETSPDGEKLPIWRISIGQDIAAVLSEENLKHAGADLSWKYDPLRRVQDGMPNDFRQGFVVMSVCKSMRHSRWFACPGAVYADVHNAGARGFHLFGRNMEWQDPRLLAYQNSPESVLDFQGDAGAIMNLSLMLSLHNVEERTEAAPEKLQRVRAKRKKQPLWSYKILVVDGEPWRPNERNSNGAGDGIRSHMRRGHIRRLSEDRRVWVRSTYVHGRAEGFVAKDYVVR